MDGRICVRNSGLRAQRSAWREFSYPLAQVSSSKSPARLSDGAPATQARQEGNSFFIQVTCTGEGEGGETGGLLKVMEKCRYSFIIDLESSVIKSKRRECERKQGRYTGYT